MHIRVYSYTHAHILYAYYAHVWLTYIWTVLYLKSFVSVKQNVLMVILFSPYAEEEMKRFQQELREDGAYNSVAFNYQYSAPEHHFHYPQTHSIYNPTGTEGMWIYVSREGELKSHIKMIGLHIGVFEKNF